MFSSIKTSKANKALVTQLTHSLGLGAENVIARLAFSFSLSKNRKLELSSIQDSGGKEYSCKVLFGDHVDYYIAIISIHYNLYKSDNDITKYIKMHIDDGLMLIEERINKNGRLTGIEFLINEVERVLY